MQVQADGQKRDGRRHGPDESDGYRNGLPGDPFGVLEGILDVDGPERNQQGIRRKVFEEEQERYRYLSIELMGCMLMYLFITI